MALDLSTLTTQQQLAAIYIGYYDRAADPVGADFWEGAVANPNLSLEDIATDFATQPETLIAYPFLDDPSEAEAEGFIAEVFLNLFNRAPDQAGLDFWSDALIGAINGTNDLSVGEIILSIIEGAQDSAEGNDRTTILNKIEVATTWTAAADAAEIDYTTDTAAQNSAKSIIEGVTDQAATVTAAKQTIDGFFVPAPVPGDTFLLTSATDVMTGTSDDDEFLAYIQQNPFAGGVSNSLSSADRLDGGAGYDRLYAEISSEFVGVNSAGVTIDIQPRLKNIEKIEFEARESEIVGAGGDDTGYFIDFLGLGDLDLDDLIGEDSDPGSLGEFIGGFGLFASAFSNPFVPTAVVDGKNITDHEEIGSYYSDGDLLIENLTTLTSSGTARNTSEITITMDHTDNFNSDGDASDLIVLFDNNYLLSGQEAEGKISYFLLDQDAELAGLEDRLFNIDVDGIRFTIDTGNGPEEVTIEAPEANIAGTHQGFVNALQPALQALIADGTLPAGTTLTLDPTETDFTFLDDGSRSDDIPAIVLTSGDGSEVIATGFTRIEEPIGEYNVYGRFRSENEVEDQPISVNVDLHKVGRGADGGDLVVGGKSDNTQNGIADGIEVFNLNVLGAGNDDPNGGMTKPSSLGTVTSTGGALAVVNIATDPMFAQGDTFASLEIRDGFGFNDDLQLVNADAFLGDLMLGTDIAVVDLDTLTAQGGGDVTFIGALTGSETGQAYSYTTAGGDDIVDLLLNGDALDYAGSSVNVATGAGDDVIDVHFAPRTENNSNNQLNQAVLDNVQIESGSGDDIIDVDGVGNANILAGSGNDIIYTDGGSTKAVWAVNFDNIRVDAQGLSNIPAGDLPGVQNSLAYVGGATITVTLSGAGISDLTDGGGVMAFGDAEDGIDGYEATATVQVAGPNTHYGTQSDVNAAIIAAIEGDAVLDALLTVTEGPNNTLLIVSKTSGDFQPTDLRIDIDQQDATTSTFADSVLTEARTIFQNSALTLTDLWGTSSFATPASYQSGAPAGETGDLTTSATADDWFDGLSVDGDAVSMADNLHTAGTASTAESDNVINGGSGDDVIVLSTDAIAGGPAIYTPGGNNSMINGASNETIVMTGANFGNDTVMNFTTATPQAQDGTAEFTTTVAALIENTDGGVETIDEPGDQEQFELDVTLVPTSPTSYTVEFGTVVATIPAGADADGIAAAIAAAFADTNASGFTAAISGTGLVTFTADAAGDVDPDVTIDNSFESTPGFEEFASITTTVQGTDDTFTISEEQLVVEYFGTPSDLSVDDEISVELNGTFGTITITVGSAQGLVPDMTPEALATLVAGEVESQSGFNITAVQSGAVVTYTAVDGGPGGDQDITFTLDHEVTGTVPLADTVAQGLDFLDFTAYLTSQFDSSTNPPGTDSNVSNQLIDVSLDYNEDNTLGGSGDGAADADVEANEVAVVRMTDGSGDTFAGLSAADVAALFNSSAASNDFANLAASTFDVIDSQSDNAVVDGAAKAIFMVEDGGNLGHYKVFELSWDAGAADGSEGVTASAIGSLDFGTSLTDLDDVNLVGSDDYALLNDVGILNYGV